MKRIIMICAAALALCSCDKWLEATSSTQYKTDEIFSSREGFQDALSGVYITMGGTSAYGADATWRIVDMTTYYYNDFEASALAAIQQHKYSSSLAKNMMSPMWTAFYNVIANANIILENIDAHADVFSNQSEMNWIKGELLAIRAYVHFDLLRIYGLPWGDDMLGKMTVPYVTSYSMEVTPQRTYRETFEMIHQDLETAIELLADDPVTGVVPDNFDSSVNADGYWSHRKKHINLYAAKALLARVCLWQKDYDKALLLAAEVIDSAVQAGLASWINPEEIVSSTLSEDKKDWTFSCEHLFSLEVTGLYNETMRALMPGSGNESGAYFLNSEYIIGTYPSYEQAGLEDIRGTAFLLKYSGNSYVCYKLYGNAGSKYRNIMPMIKLSEMYMIIAEIAVLAGEDQVAHAALDIIRHYRGITDPLNEKVEITLHDILEEYAKEFLNEGQTFHAAKRLMSIGVNPVIALMKRFAPEDLIYPYPDEEINYGRVQEM